MRNHPLGKGDVSIFVMYPCHHRIMYTHVAKIGFGVLAIGIDGIFILGGGQPILHKFNLGLLCIDDVLGKLTHGGIFAVF